MQLIEGKNIAAEIKEGLKLKVAALKKGGIEPGLATILVGNDQASQIYVSSKIKACETLGIRSFHHRLPETSSEEDIKLLINKLNADTRVHGILLQIPLPQNLKADECLNEIAPSKDVDGLHPYSIGRLVTAKSWNEIESSKLLVPCTPLGIMMLLEKYKIEVSGKKAVVIGRSNLVGKPISMLLLSKNATVTMAHSKTANLPGVCREHDIVVAAIGKARFVTKDFIKSGAVVIDVGINRSQDGLCGDVDFDAVKEIAGAITPVPGGVGAMTIAMLMNNTVLASQRQL